MFRHCGLRGPCGTRLPAVRRCPDGRGHILCRTESLGDRIAVEIADDGPGIPAEHLPRIFDPFFTTREIGEGTGLGLSITYGIVRQHGGSIRAENRPGGGASVRIELPVRLGTSPPPDRAARETFGTLLHG